MNIKFSKLTAGIMAACISLSMGVYASAAPNDYSVTMTSSGQLQLQREGGGVAPYDSVTGDIIVKMDKSTGALLLQFTTGSTQRLVSLGAQSELVFNGNISSLTIDSSVTQGHTIIINGSISGTLSVSAPVAVTLGAQSSVATLNVANSTATVTAAAGAKVSTANAVRTANITGISSVNSVSASQQSSASSATSSSGLKLNNKGAPSAKKTSLTLGGASTANYSSGSGSVTTIKPPASTTASSGSSGNTIVRSGSLLNNSSSSNLNNQSGKIRTFLEVNDRGDKERNKNGVPTTIAYVQGSESISWLNDYEVEIEAGLGNTLGRCMQDMILTVKRVDDDTRVSGSWKWLSGGTSTATDGTYQYQFTPTFDTYPTTTITVHFKANGSGRKLSKPTLKFRSNQRNHGEAGTYVSVVVGIPENVIDDDELNIYVDNKLSDTIQLSDGDADDDMDVNVYIPEDYDPKDKIKIKVRIKKGTGGSSSTSKSLTYEIDE